MTFPGLSVIIPCYNQVSSLPRAIESALAADAGDVIVVSDDTIENTDYLINTLGRSSSDKVCFVSTGGPFPIGISQARNLGIFMTRHEWILPLDADDELLLNGIKALMNIVMGIRTFEPIAVYGDYVVNDATVKNADPGMIYRKSVCHATVLFSKEDWRRVGGYKPEFNVGCEDWEFMLSLADAGVKLIHINTPIYRKTINPNGRGAKCLERRPLIASLLKEYHPKVQL